MEDIGEILKEEGLEIAEDTVAAMVKATFRILPLLAKKTSNKYDDLLIPVLAVIEPKVLEMVDKIDGKDDPNL